MAEWAVASTDPDDDGGATVLGRGSALTSSCYSGEGVVDRPDAVAPAEEIESASEGWETIYV